MPISLQVVRKLRPVALLLMGLLTGCGGGGTTSITKTSAATTSTTTTTPVVNALTNPDKILFTSGRAAGAEWQYYAMNPDGSGVTPVQALNTLTNGIGVIASNGMGIALNQTGTIAGVTGMNFESYSRALINLSDGTALYNDSVNGTFAGITANSTGSQLAVVGISGSPAGIYLLNTDGTYKNQVVSLATDILVPEVIFAPDDKTLYYVEASDAGSQPGNGILYKLPSGGTPVAVANVNSQIRSIHTSRDGTKLAFIAYAEAADQSSLTFTAYTLNADGTGLTKGATTTITEAVAPWNVCIASRADGFHVLYVDTIGGTEEIADMSPNGSNLKQITFNAAGNWSPGSRAATIGTIHALGGR